MAQWDQPVGLESKILSPTVTAQGFIEECMTTLHDISPKKQAMYIKNI